MQLSIDETYNKWWVKIMRPYFDQDQIEEAFDRMRPILEKAIEAERAGRIIFMQPAIALVNSTESMQRGEFNLEIIFQPVVDGIPGQRQRWIKNILKKEEENAGIAQEKEGQAVES